MTELFSSYVPERVPQSRFVEARGVRHHVLSWEERTSEQPPLMMVHGYMDVAASFQFLVDAMQVLEGPVRSIYALDLRGYGLTESPSTDAYWYPDYLADLDAVTTALLGNKTFDLLGHSMGGNVSMLYAGVRPTRVRKLVNLEGFGLPDTQPEEAPQRLSRWLDELATPQRMPTFESYDAVADRLQRNNPRIAREKARFLAQHWAGGEAGALRVRGDGAHKRVNPILYRASEAMACWARITAKVMCVEGKQTPVDGFWKGRYSLSEFHARLSVVPDVRRVVIDDAGHMLHHDQPEALAAQIVPFLRA